jgi:hypothetical protein
MLSKEELKLVAFKRNAEKAKKLQKLEFLDSRTDQTLTPGGEVLEEGSFGALGDRSTFGSGLGSPLGSGLGSTLGSNLGSAFGSMTLVGNLPEEGSVAPFGFGNKSVSNPNIHPQFPSGKFRTLSAPDPLTPG